MKSFSGLSQVIAENIIIPLAKRFYVPIYVEETNNIFFLNVLKRKLNRGFNIYHNYPNESFPQFPKTNITLSINKKTIINSGSMHFDKDICSIKAKGEFLERLSSYLPFNVARNYDFNRDKVFLNKECVYAERLLGFGWRKVSVGDVYYGLKNYRGSKNRTHVKKQITTNGGAGHFDYKKAVLNGWLELIQRDAFLVHWLNTISPAKIDIEEFAKKNETAKKIIETLKRYNIEYHFLDITSDIAVPTCVCTLVIDSVNGKGVSIGASSGFNVEEIIKSSMLEALSVLSYEYDREGKEFPSLKEDYVPFSDYNVNMRSRIRMYFSGENFDKFEFFISSNKKVSAEDFITINKTVNVPKDDTKEQLKNLKKIFKEGYKNSKDYDVLVYEIKNSLLDAFDYRVVRVMCSALYYMYLEENFADPDHPRLREFVKNKGLENVAKLNIWPHPFP